jgi:hypothetical protein
VVRPYCASVPAIFLGNLRFSRHSPSACPCAPTIWVLPPRPALARVQAWGGDISCDGVVVVAARAALTWANQETVHITAAMRANLGSGHLEARIGGRFGAADRHSSYLSAWCDLRATPIRQRGRPMFTSFSNKLATPLVEAFRAAPSLDNSQPWQLAVEGGELRLYGVPDRALWVSDPLGRGCLSAVAQGCSTPASPPAGLVMISASDCCRTRNIRSTCSRLSAPRRATLVIRRDSLGARRSVGRARARRRVVPAQDSQVWPMIR